MKEETEKAHKEKKRFRLELSRTALFFWSLGFLIFLGWIFTLGVLAGRGLLPSGAKTLAELRNQILKLQEMVGRKDTSELDEIKAVQKDSKFAFYDALSSKSVPAPTMAQTPRSKSVQPADSKSKTVEAPAARLPAAERYVVQVASLDQEKEASGMVDRLVKKGYPAYHYKIFIKGRSYFRVRCGTFKTRAEAGEILRRLAQKENLKGFVQKVKSQ